MEPEEEEKKKEGAVPDELIALLKEDAFGLRTCVTLNKQ